MLVNQNGLIDLFAFEKMSDDILLLLLESKPQGGLTLNLIYGGINALILLDLTWKTIALLRVRKWRAWAARKSITRRRLDIAQNFALPVLLLVGLPALSLTTQGVAGTQVLFYYDIFDIAVWLAVSSLLSIARGLLKIKRFVEII